MTHRTETMNTVDSSPVQTSKPAGKQPDKVLILENLTKRFGKFTAVNNISLAVKRGEIFGFLGPNGAGKTTTIKMIAGLLKPDNGQIYVNGHDLAQDTRNHSAIDTRGSFPYIYSLRCSNVQPRR